jgi:hypothetical protein
MDFQPMAISFGKKGKVSGNVNRRQRECVWKEKLA